MRRAILWLLSLVILWSPGFAQAGPREEYDEAYAIYVAAGASVAAYNDRIGELAGRYLAQDGWQMDYYVQAEGQAGARFLLAQKISAAGNKVYVLAIVGTENNKDIKINLKVGKVYFAGATLAEFAANAAKEAVPSTEPKVHRGFHEFVQAGPAAVLRDDQDRAAPLVVSDLLKSDSNSKLYLTGHSLGGAAAILSGARLISMGVNPEQIEVITFGAPAVGNTAFAAKFEQDLRLTRVVISGDPVNGALQALVGGYKQFGNRITWDIPAAVDDSHEMIGYVDMAIKNYYDKRRQAIQAGFAVKRPFAPDRINPGPVYIATPVNDLPDALSREFGYMREALQDEYEKDFANVTVEKEGEDGGWREKTAASGCRWAILSKISAERLKYEKNAYYVVLTQTIYDVDTGTVFDVAAFSTGTYRLTPLEAFIHSFKGMSSHQVSRF